MTAIAQPLPPSSSNISPTSRNFILSAGFWLFSYAMLTFRGALLMDWAPVMDAQRILAENQPTIYFVAPKVTVAVSRRVGGAVPVLLEPKVLWNAESLFIRP